MDISASTLFLQKFVKKAGIIGLYTVSSAALMFGGAVATIADDGVITISDNDFKQRNDGGYVHEVSPDKSKNKFLIDLEDEGRSDRDYLLEVLDIVPAADNSDGFFNIEGLEFRGLHDNDSVVLSFGDTRINGGQKQIVPAEFVVREGKTLFLKDVVVKNLTLHDRSKLEISLDERARYLLPEDIAFGSNSSIILNKGQHVFKGVSDNSRNNGKIILNKGAALTAEHQVINALHSIKMEGGSTLVRVFADSITPDLDKVRFPGLTENMTMWLWFLSKNTGATVEIDRNYSDKRINWVFETRQGSTLTVKQRVPKKKLVGNTLQFIGKNLELDGSDLNIEVESLHIGSEHNGNVIATSLLMKDVNYSQIKELNFKKDSSVTFSGNSLDLTKTSVISPSDFVNAEVAGNGTSLKVNPDFMEIPDIEIGQGTKLECKPEDSKVNVNIRKISGAGELIFNAEDLVQECTAYIKDDCLVDLTFRAPSSYTLFVKGDSNSSNKPKIASENITIASGKRVEFSDLGVITANEFVVEKNSELASDSALNLDKLVLECGNVVEFSNDSSGTEIRAVEADDSSEMIIKSGVILHVHVDDAGNSGMPKMVLEGNSVLEHKIKKDLALLSFDKYTFTPDSTVRLSTKTNSTVALKDYDQLEKLELVSKSGRLTVKNDSLWKQQQLIKTIRVIEGEALQEIESAKTSVAKGATLVIGSSKGPEELELEEGGSRVVFEQNAQLSKITALGDSTINLGRSKVKCDSAYLKDIVNVEVEQNDVGSGSLVVVGGIEHSDLKQLVINISGTNILNKLDLTTLLNFKDYQACKNIIEVRVNNEPVTFDLGSSSLLATSTQSVQAEKLFDFLSEEQKQNVQLILDADAGSDACKTAETLKAIAKNPDEASNLVQQLTASSNLLSSVPLTSVLSAQTGISDRLVKVAVAAGDDEHKGTKFGVWVESFVGSASTIGKMNRGDKAHKATTTGGTVGIDTPLSDNFVLGFAYTRSNAKIKPKNRVMQDQKRVDSDVYSLYGLYTAPSGKFFVEGITSYSDCKIKATSKRSSVSQGGATVTQNAISRYNSHLYTGQVLVGFPRTFKTALSLTATPLVGFRYSNVHNGKYTETGTSSPLTVSRTHYELFDAILGMKLSGNINRPNMVFVPEMRVMVNYSCKDKLPAIKAKLQGMSSPFVIDNFIAKGLNFDLGAGLTLKYKRMEYGINYDMRIATKRFTHHQGSFKVRVNL